jgi:hypothetical protein
MKAHSRMSRNRQRYHTQEEELLDWGWGGGQLPRLNFTDNTQKSYLETLLRDLLRYPTQIPYSDTLLRNQRSRETRDLIFFHSVTRKRNLKKQTSKKKVIKIFEKNYRKENLNTGPNIRKTQNKRREDRAQMQKQSRIVEKTTQHGFLNGWCSEPLPFHNIWKHKRQRTRGSRSIAETRQNTVLTLQFPAWFFFFGIAFLPLNRTLSVADLD